MYIGLFFNIYVKESLTPSTFLGGAYKLTKDVWMSLQKK